MRDEIIHDWLARTGWANWQRTAMTGDASARRYERLTNAAGQSVILMDAPPDICESQSRFVQIAAHLRSLALAAPEVLEWDETHGLMILEDLGSVDFAQHLLSSPEEEQTLYQDAADILLTLQSAPPPNGLVHMTPTVGADMIDIAFQWAAKDQSPDLQAEIKARVHTLLTQTDPTPSVLSLRDFHAENLIWRAHKPGQTKVGLLDFQDAFVTHPMYDLASLLRDARRDVSPALLDILLDRFVSSRHDIGSLKHAFHIMAVQRNLRILGIFKRLASQDGKTGYLSLIPRVQTHLAADLAAPICADLAPLVRRAFNLPKELL